MDRRPAARSTASAASTSTERRMESPLAQGVRPVPRHAARSLGESTRTSWRVPAPLASRSGRVCQPPTPSPATLPSPPSSISRGGPPRTSAAQPAQASSGSSRVTHERRATPSTAPSTGNVLEQRSVHAPSTNNSVGSSRTSRTMLSGHSTRAVLQEPRASSPPTLTSQFGSRSSISRRAQQEPRAAPPPTMANPFERSSARRAQEWQNNRARGDVPPDLQDSEESSEDQEWQTNHARGDVPPDLEDSEESSEDEETSQPQVHLHVRCDGCGRGPPLFGRVMRCADCENFDFCAECHRDRAGSHIPGHRFEVREAESREVLAELLRLVEDEMLHDALLRSTEADDQARAEADARAKEAHATEVLAELSRVPWVPSTDSADGLNVEEECALCLEEYHPHEEVLKLPCGHIFHEACLGPWFARSCSCPMCKADIA
uniref:RING-type domain-containing protein n=1 Tax=Noctiluca scintillans TaxID=2966 RepID=A0A7S1APB0_NOCSC|mmetsp:Transcript_54582/g.145775  ORF Transcript_54582/g.145775 Transcript_54582/m.145775 type:complete len:433 (+) Transcript_54582:86-1384(+)